jgi:signal recognition particle subunit SRP54
MTELEKVKARTDPQEVLLVVDAMTGQDAVRVADEFNKRVGLTGLILTKVDGDARGGAAISVRAVTGVPIKFLGVGEKTDALEVFHPDRLAGRILGMGDVLSAIEKAQQVMDQESALKMGQKMVKGEFDLEDFRAQLQQLKKMGPLTQLLDMIPGLSSMTKQLSPDVTDQQLKVIEAIINSMTSEERHIPRIINASRKRRISRGSGTSVQDVNELLLQFRQMQKMMKQLGDMGKHGRGRMRGLLSMFGGLG